MKTNNENALKNNRIEWIDVAKGISMLCIIAGHMNIDIVNRIVFIFHVPIFFLFSGYFIARDIPFDIYIKRRFKELICPYLFTTCLIMLGKTVIDLLYGSPQYIFSDLKRIFIQALYGSGNNLNKTFWNVQQIGAVWFLLALFWATLLVKYYMNIWYGIFAIIFIAIVAYISTFYFYLPWSVQSGATASLFVFVGALLKRNKNKIKANWIMLVASIAILIIAIIFDVNVDIARNYYSHYGVSAIVAIAVSYIVCCISKLLVGKEIIREILSFWGKNSIIILCFHLFELYLIPWNYVYEYINTKSMWIKTLGIVLCFAFKLGFLFVATLMVLRNKYLRKVFGK